jgi:predicted metalloenzyme YecM
VSEFGPNNFERSVKQYADLLTEFRYAHGLLAKSLFKIPDHLAIKCHDASHFEETLETWKPRAAQASWVWLNRRRLASIQLQEELLVGEFGAITWLEIMEPRPERVGKDIVGIEHMEFVVPNLELMQTKLNDRGIDFEPQHNEHHAWLNIPINQLGQELKFTNTTLLEMTEIGLENGDAEIVI